MSVDKRAVPASGVTASTVPAASLDFSSVTSTLERPSAASRSTASCWVSPATAGTVRATATVSSTVLPSSARPPSGAAASTVPGASSDFSSVTAAANPFSARAASASAWGSPTTEGTVLPPHISAM